MLKKACLGLVFLLTCVMALVVAPDDVNRGALVAFSLFVTAIVFACATISNDNLQDLKTGQLVGASPMRQQIALIVGVAAGAAVIPSVLNLLAKAYGFAGAANAGVVAANPLPAPQATLMSTIITGLLNRNLPWGLVLVAVFASVTLELCGVTINPGDHVGVNLVAALTKRVARVLDQSFDVEVLEMHHNKKIDAPSGTALMFGRAAAEGRGIDLDTHSERGRDGETGARKPGSIGFASLRGGNVVGDHHVIFAGPAERIELVHKAQDRMLFASGAVHAALQLARVARLLQHLNAQLGQGTCQPFRRLAPRQMYAEPLPRDGDPVFHS